MIKKYLNVLNLSFFTILLSGILVQANTYPPQLYVERQPVNDIILDYIKLNMVSFEGDANSVNRLISEQTGVHGQVLDGSVIRFQFKDQECTASHGVYDGYTCDQSKDVTNVFYVGPRSQWNQASVIRGTKPMEKVCFQNEILNALDFLTKAQNVKPETLGQIAIRYFKTEILCLESHGQYDGYTCDVSTKVSVPHYVENCALVNDFNDYAPLP